MPDIIDDKSPHVIPFILARLHEHRKQSDAPFFIGLNGVQGIGKTTLVTSLATTLRSPPHNLPTLTFSIDDLYLPYTAQTALAASDPSNPLIQQRGQPSTHDMALGLSLFRALRDRESDIRIPAYDKSARGGKGDRVPEGEWDIVNQAHDGSGKVEVVIFEGWCVGFRSLPDAAVKDAWDRARGAASSSSGDGDAAADGDGAGNTAGRLYNQRLSDIQLINSALRSGYDHITGYLDAFVYLDAEKTSYVYAWRQEQEAELRAKKGEWSAMSESDVVRFVDGYYPAYELFGEGVRRGVFRRGDGDGEGGRQMRLVVSRDRAVKFTEVV